MTSADLPEASSHMVSHPGPSVTGGLFNFLPCRCWRLKQRYLPAPWRGTGHHEKTQIQRKAVMLWSSCVASGYPGVSITSWVTPMV